MPTLTRLQYAFNAHREPRSPTGELSGGIRLSASSMNGTDTDHCQALSSLPLTKTLSPVVSPFGDDQASARSSMSSNDTDNHQGPVHDAARSTLSSLADRAASIQWRHQASARSSASSIDTDNRPGPFAPCRPQYSVLADQSNRMDMWKHQASARRWMSGTDTDNRQGLVLDAAHTLSFTGPPVCPTTDGVCFCRPPPPLHRRSCRGEYRVSDWASVVVLALTSDRNSYHRRCWIRGHAGERWWSRRSPPVCC